MSIGDAVGASLMVSSVAVTGLIIVPTAVATGHGTEAGASAAAATVCYIAYRMIFGEEEAERRSAEQQAATKSRQKKRRGG